MNTYSIPMSRIPLAVLFFAGNFFFFVGLDVGFLHSFIGPLDIDSGRIWAYYAFLFFFVAGGGAIAVQMLLYFIKPPIMLNATAEGISFGTGFRYRPYTIPWKFVDTVGAGIDLSQIPAGKIQGGLQISFKPSDEIPGMKATSIGIAYFMHTLTLSIFYMGRPVREAIEILRKMHQQSK